jgi:hypothetical protein
VSRSAGPDGHERRVRTLPGAGPLGTLRTGVVQGNGMVDVSPFSDQSIAGD